VPLLNDLTMFFLTNTIFSVFEDKDSLNVGNVFLTFKLKKAKTSWTYCSLFRWRSSSPLHSFCSSFVFVVSESFLDLSPKCHKTLLWFIPLSIYKFSHHSLMSPWSHKKWNKDHISFCASFGSKTNFTPCYFCFVKVSYLVTSLVFNYAKTGQSHPPNQATLWITLQTEH
jgi:hypothetical protein